MFITGEVSKVVRKEYADQVYLRKASVMFSGNDSYTEWENIAAVVTFDSPEDDADIPKTGNIMSGECIFREFKTAGNYGNYDEWEYYYSNGIDMLADNVNMQITDHRTDIYRQFLNDLRNRLTESVYNAAGDDETAGILTAICTGDRSGLTEESRTMYRRSGIAHVLAVSGLHISMLGMTLFRLLRKKLRFAFSAVISGVFMVSFCIMSGSSPSAVRAVIMFLIQLLAAGLGKTYDILCAMSSACIILLISEPRNITNSAFILSFCAILGAGLLNETAAAWAQPRSRFGKSILMSLCITMTTVPVTAGLYYELPLYSIFINVVVIPLMSIVLGSGMLSSAAGLISTLSGRFMMGAGAYLVRLISMICGIAESLPFSIIVTGNTGAARTIIYYVLLAVCMFLMKITVRGISSERTALPKTALKRRAVRKAAAAAVISAVLVMVLFLDFRSGTLNMVFIDVGQGDCILLESPAGSVYMIDAGSSTVSNPAGSRISGALKYRGISSVDYMFITHPDTDHCSGVLEMIGSTGSGNEGSLPEIRCILMPSMPDNETCNEIKRAAALKGINVIELHKGMEITDGALRIKCIHPAAEYKSDDINDCSAVLDIRYGDFSALLTGDLEKDGEVLIMDELRTDMPEGNYDVLKVAHHGSKNSTSSEFLELVMPDIAVISSGRNNKYGHPHKETVERLETSGARIYNTQNEGEIIITADGDGIKSIETKR
ncbi:MAG: DNA internalization-related competence protein ComEC/Rec2 [Parasporobacterium sp.]|nr:DNA internalization-related competence protein ComEC/Rec2 [Parasporobacterium sp.]